MPKTTPNVRPKLRIFLVDDHPIVRRGFQVLIGMERDMIVCGEADNGPAALEKIMALKPDLAIVDLSLGAGNGLDLVKQLHSHCPKLKMLVFTMRAEVMYAERALRAGAQGYITKEEGTDKAISAIRLLMQGRTCLSDKLASKMVERMAGAGARQTNSLESLSDRELEVLELIGQGLGSREIAGRLHISVKTVESHREHLKGKLALKSAPELVRYAFNWVQSDQGTQPAQPGASRE